ASALPPLPRRGEAPPADRGVLPARPRENPSSHEEERGSSSSRLDCEAAWVRYYKEKQALWLHVFFTPASTCISRGRTQSGREETCGHRHRDQQHQAAGGRDRRRGIPGGPLAGEIAGSARKRDPLHRTASSGGDRGRRFHGGTVLALSRGSGRG